MTQFIFSSSFLCEMLLVFFRFLICWTIGQSFQFAHLTHWKYFAMPACRERTYPVHSVRRLVNVASRISSKIGKYEINNYLKFMLKFVVHIANVVSYYHFLRKCFSKTKNKILPSCFKVFD